MGFVLGVPALREERRSLVVPLDVLSDSRVDREGTGDGGDVGGKGRMEASSSASGSTVRPQAESGRKESDFAEGECTLRGGTSFPVPRLAANER